MSSDDFASQILSASASGLGRLAAERLPPELLEGEQYGDAPVALWSQQLADRVGDLSLALVEQRPELFALQLGWAKVALASRGLPSDDLAAALGCLRQVLAEELPESVAGAATRCLDGALDRWAQLGYGEPAAIDTDTSTGQLATQVLLALLEADRGRAGDLLLGAVRTGALSPQDAIVDVCLRLEKELGRMWHRDEITVAEEHFATSSMVRLMAQMVCLAPRPEPTGRTLLSACVSGDEHDFGLSAVSDLFELDGWRVIFLGRSVPLDDLCWSARTFGADLLLLSATLPAHVRGVEQAIVRLRDAESGLGSGLPVLVGGPGWMSSAERARAAGASALAQTAREAVALGRRLVRLDGGPAG